jgi:DNA-binding transcriptional ArsR family regulator
MAMTSRPRSQLRPFPGVRRLPPGSDPDGAEAAAFYRFDLTHPGRYYLNSLVNEPVGLIVTDPLSFKFAALADPTRRAMLARLALGDTTLSDLAKPFDMSIPAVAKHLAVLERAGLVKRGRRAQSRPASLRVTELAEMTDWIEGCRLHWEGSFDRLANYLDATDGGGSDDG